MDVVNNSLYERDEATLKGLKLMLMGFAYLIGTVVLFAIMRIIESS